MLPICLANVKNHIFSASCKLSSNSTYLGSMYSFVPGIMLETEGQVRSAPCSQTFRICWERRRQSGKAPKHGQEQTCGSSEEVQLILSEGFKEGSMCGFLEEEVGRRRENDKKDQGEDIGQDFTGVRKGSGSGRAP